MKKRYDKLIRDRIPDIMREAGVEFAARTLDGDAYAQALRAKLVEEAQEAAQAARDGLTDELADVMEVVQALAQQHDIDLRDLENVRRARADERGGFARRLFLEWAEAQDG